MPAGSSLPVPPTAEQIVISKTPNLTFAALGEGWRLTTTEFYLVTDSFALPFGRTGEALPSSAKVTPPRIAPVAETSLHVICSPKNTTPATAAMIGTVSCTIAARVVVKLRKAMYQIAYPRPDVTAPEIVANTMPNELA